MRVWWTTVASGILVRCRAGRSNCRRSATIEQHNCCAYGEPGTGEAAPARRRHL